MKLTNKQLKKIIKEEISSVLNEAQNNQIKIGDEEIKAGKEMQNTPIGNAIFKQLLKDPNVQKELKKVAAQVNEDETGSPGAGALPTIGAMGGTAVAAPAIQQAVLAGLTSGKLGAAVAGVLKGAGIAGAAMMSGAAAGFLVFVALGGAAAILGKASMSLDRVKDKDIPEREIGYMHYLHGELVSKEGGQDIYKKTEKWKKQNFDNVTTRN